MARKAERHEAILELVKAQAIASQEELRQRMVERGWQVTQATLSRDLRELGVLRAPTETGSRYRLAERLGDDGNPYLDNLLPQLFSRIDGVGELIVLHTLSSGAQPISEAIDLQDWPEVIGTIAGENTVLIVCRSADARIAVSERITRLAVGE